ncbi:hypothetical protein KEM60_02665 [Austwickia sp. TVS 96-490-7B]|nr:hypothetical protein [Austwickia sp. TVS 96-490-7B]
MGKKSRYRTENIRSISVVTLLVAGVVGLYAAGVMWATLTSGVCVLSLSSPALPDPATTPRWEGAPGATLMWPYHVGVDVSRIPGVIAVVVQLGAALTPACWALSLAALGAFMRQVARVRSVFDPSVERALRIFMWSVIGVALVPTGLTLLGSQLAVNSLGWHSAVSTDLSSIWLPLGFFYLSWVFMFVLRHGRRLVDELDGVI